ncbi:MAG: TRAP transporter small permease [Rhizobiaceae bacterium]
MRKNRFSAAVEASARLLASVGAICAFLMFVAIMVDIVWREFLRGSTEYAVDLSELLMAPLVFLMLPYVAQVGANVKVDIIVDSLRPRLRRALGVVANILMLAFSALIGWAGWLATYDAYRFSSITESGIPKWLSLASMPFGCFVLCLQLMVIIGTPATAKGH